MATQIQLTRSGSPGEQPSATEIELGELALNYADGKLYYKDDSNNIAVLNSTYNNSGQKIFVNETDEHIGLKTTSPGFLLDLGGNSSSVDNTLRLNQNDGGTAVRIGGSANGDITLLRVDNADGETNSGAEGFTIKYLGTNPNNELGIFADNSGTEFQALTILQDGKIGIGTGTPAKELDVNGSAIVQANFEASGDLTIGGNTVLGNATSDTVSISGALTVDTDTLVVDESNDRVGINNSGPSEALDVTGNIVSSATISGTTISGTTLTDGTASISGGAITGATDINASGNVTAADPTLSTHLATKNYVDSSSLGVGQTWQEVTRVIDDTTVYTNDTGKPIEVKGAFYTGTDAHQIHITVIPSGGFEFEFIFARGSNTGGGVYSNGSCIIPNNTSYKFRRSGQGDFIGTQHFVELR